MTLEEKIAARLKAKAAGVNLSKTRIDAIVARAKKGLTDESDDTSIDANLDAINELTPFKDIASLDDHERAKAKKIADDKEAKRLADIEAGKTPEVEVPNEAPEWFKTFMTANAATTKVLTDKIEAISGDKVATTRRDQFIKAMEGTPKEYQAKELKRFDRIAFKDDEDFNSFLDDTKDDHAAAIQKDANAGMGNDRPAGGAGGNNVSTKKEATEAEVEEAFANIRI